MELNDDTDNTLHLAATEGGAYYLFDTAGTLRYRDRYYFPGENPSAVYWLESAIVNHSTGYFIFGLLSGMPIYRIEL